MATPSPTFGEPEQEPESTAAPETVGSELVAERPPSPQIEQQPEESLAEAIDRLGIESPEQLSNMATAAEQSHRVSEMLREEQQAVRDGKARLQEMEAQLKMHQQAKPPPVEKDNAGPEPYPFVDPVPVLPFSEMSIDAQIQADVDSITRDKMFGYVRNAFHRRLQNPRTRDAVNSGQRRLIDEYQDLAMKAATYRLTQETERMKPILERSERLKSNIPHIESGGMTSAAFKPESRKVETKRKLLKIDQESLANDDRVRSMLDVLLPDGDLTEMRMKSR